MGTSVRTVRGRFARAATAGLLAAGIAATVSVQGAGASGVAAHNLHTRGLKTGSSTSNLIDHGGEVLLSSNTYALWWGSGWAGDVKPGITTLFQGFQGSAYLGIAQQYMRTSTTIGSIFAGATTDSSSPPSKVSPSTLGNEVVKVYGLKNIVANGIYFVYTSNFPRGGNFCAWHSYATTSTGVRFAVAYMPNTTNVAGCNPGTQFGDPTQSEGLRSLANVTAHEFMESVTDTLPANGTYGWIDSSGSEIGDKCAWQFASTVTLGNKSVWQLQEEWSNAAGGCVQG